MPSPYYQEPLLALFLLLHPSSLFPSYYIPPL
ncbi:hypothetical protein E2C01_024638 [Portunus trituberculatus]|uniref:Uncharacterized protein n=1 Tax=Portunus trituberculatus TaxID=210409 RepID=A0A5B7EB64_PORTR|nr:hypothetical protein [Portunus trituberculatus]